MAISFEESKRRVADIVAKQNSMVVNFDISPVNESVSDFERSSAYLWYDDYLDTEYSSIGLNKEIVLNPNQLNLTQESNSQVIPFEMPRYYDGVDLMNMTLRIHFINANNVECFSFPINVCYNSKSIRFYWLIDNDATVKDGSLKFEVIAFGTITVPGSGATKQYL